jgi:hypothetical protein
LAVDGYGGIEEGSVEVVGAEAHGKCGGETVLQGATSGPGKFVGVAGNHLSGGGEVDAGFASGAGQGFDLQVVSRVASDVEDGPGEIIQNVSGVPGASNVEAARVASIEFEADAMGKFGAEGGVRAVERNTTGAGNVHIDVSRAEASFKDRTTTGEDRALREGGILCADLRNEKQRNEKSEAAPHLFHSVSRKQSSLASVRDGLPQGAP